MQKFKDETEIGDDELFQFSIGMNISPLERDDVHISIHTGQHNVAKLSMEELAGTIEQLQNIYDWTISRISTQKNYDAAHPNRTAAFIAYANGEPIDLNNLPED